MPVNKAELVEVVARSAGITKVASEKALRDAGGGTRTSTPPLGTTAFKAGASHPFRHPGDPSVRRRF